MTDHPWPDVDIERDMLAAAGLELVAGPANEGPSPSAVEAMIAANDPVAIMTCWARVTAAAIAAPSDLALVARLGVGLDNIDIDAATRRGTWVTNVPDYCTDEVSDHAVALVLDAYRGISRLSAAVRAGTWDPSSGKSLLRVREATVGIIGFGRIGRMTGSKLAAFGCEILGYSRSLAKGRREFYEAVDLAEIAARSDVVIMHAPLTPDSHHLLDDAFFLSLKRKPLIVNLGRGAIIDTDALVRALGGGYVSAAALDVLESEPSVPSTLRERANVVLTPHVGASSTASLIDLRRRASEEVVRVLRGDAPIFPCNLPARAESAQA
jgi:D-3-phosphoglycerate dehydrogenase